MADSFCRLRQTDTERECDNCHAAPAINTPLSRNPEHNARKSGVIAAESERESGKFQVRALFRGSRVERNQPSRRGLTRPEPSASNANPR